MTSQRVKSLILAFLMALTLVAPPFAAALAEAAAAPEAAAESAAPEAAAPEASAAAPEQTPASGKKTKQYKVKFVDAVTGKAIGDTQRVNKGEAAVAPEVPDHADLGFQFAGWSRDFSSVGKNITVTARYASLHQVVPGDFDTATATPGGALKLALPVIFKNALTRDEISSNTLANGRGTGYDAEREIRDYDQKALAGQGIEWIRVDLNLSGTPLKGDKDARSAYVLRSLKDSKKKYGVPSGQPVNRGFATFGKIKARADAEGGSYTLKGTSYGGSRAQRWTMNSPLRSS